MKHGHGIYHYKMTGQVYEGEWLNDLWSGRGVYSVANGQVRINGIWEKGILNGLTEVFHQNGERFIGNFKNGLKQGSGRIYYPNNAFF